MDRALSDDPKVSARTWAKIENLLVALEDELGMAESGHLVVSTVTIGDTAVMGDEEREAILRLDNIA